MDFDCAAVLLSMRFGPFHLILCSLLLSASCGKETSVNPSNHVKEYELADLEFDNRWGAPKASAQSIELSEASGAVRASKWSKGAWIINDSGDSSMLYLLNIHSGEMKLKLSVHGMVNIDWEDMASFIDSNGQNWLFIGDIGDNLERRASVDLYAFPEPEISGFDTLSSMVQVYNPSIVKHWNYVYENGPHDAEALFVDPMSGKPYVWSKWEERNSLYELPLLAGSGIDTARMMQSFPFSLSTASDCVIQDDGSMPIILRSYQFALIWNRTSNQTVLEALAQKPLKLPYRGNELQGECIWWTSVGWATVSEEIAGVKPVIWRYDQK